MVKTCLLFITIIVIAPYRLGQGIEGNDISLVFPQFFQQGQFFCRQRQFRAVAAEDAGAAEMNRFTAQGEDGVLGRRISSLGRKGLVI